MSPEVSMELVARVVEMTAKMNEIGERAANEIDVISIDGGLSDVEFPGWRSRGRTATYACKVDLLICAMHWHCHQASALLALLEKRIDALRVARPAIARSEVTIEDLCRPRGQP